jgi:hypothetical protein
MTDLFMEAAREVEAEQLAERCAMAKVAVADVWTFLALAQSVREFDHRLALAHSRVAASVDPELLEVTLAALRDDFAEVVQLREIDQQKTAAEIPLAPAQAGQQVWHVGQRRWITVQAADLPPQPETRDNPYGQGSNYFEDAAEEGPNTGQTGTYPQFPAGPDPVDPLNSLFPMQPSAWTVPPDAGWVERPMQFSRGGASRSSVGLMGHGNSLARSAVATVLAGAGYVGEGVQNGPGNNPDFFSGGSEGVGGDPQNDYPVDLAVEDPDDRANEIYGGVPPQPSSGSTQGGAQPYSNPGVSRQGAFFDPSDLGVKVIAQTGDVTDTGGGLAPEPPQSMMPGGVGSIAQEPLLSGSGMGNPMDPGGADAANKMPPMTGVRSRSTYRPGNRIDTSMFARIAADTIRQRPSDVNPTGVADEFDDNTWDSAANTRPRQPAQDRNINTPQTSRDPIPQASSSDIQRELSEDEDRLRQAVMRASRFALAGGAR